MVEYNSVYSITNTWYAVVVFLIMVEWSDIQKSILAFLSNHHILAWCLGDHYYFTEDRLENDELIRSGTHI